LVILMQDNLGPVQVQATGDFAQTNDCASASYARPYCSFNVTFTPTAAGTRNGNLAITYNLNPPQGSPSTLNIPLSGVGVGTFPPIAPRPGRGPRPTGSQTIHAISVHGPQDGTSASLARNRRRRKLSPAARRKQMELEDLQEKGVH